MARPLSYCVVIVMCPILPSISSVSLIYHKNLNDAPATVNLFGALATQK